MPLGPLSVIAFLNSMLVAPRGERGKNFSSNAWRKERRGEGLSRKGGGGSRSSGQDSIELSFFFFFFFSFRTWLANYLASNMKSGGNRSLSGWEEKKGRRAI